MPHDQPCRPRPPERLRCPLEGDETDPGPALASATAALSGAHDNLNLIGVARDKSPNLSGGEGRRIFVRLEGKTEIALQQGDFSVLDAYGTDGSASFQLPNPAPDNDGTTTSSMYSRALGKPGGRASMSTCATDVAGTRCVALEPGT